MFFTLIYHTPRGRLETLNPYWSWEGLCRNCRKTTQTLRGFYCANCGNLRRGHIPCFRSWHPEYHKACQKLKFHTALPENYLGSKWIKQKYEARFMHARPGGNLLAPFQCDWCWFENLEGRRTDPEIYSDSQMLGYICRANFDFFGYGRK